VCHPFSLGVEDTVKRPISQRHEFTLTLLAIEVADNSLKTDRTITADS
jgi:hypothetical protein